MARRSDQPLVHLLIARELVPPRLALERPVTSWSLTPGPGRNPWALLRGVPALPEFDMIRAVLLVVLAVLGPSPALAESVQFADESLR